MYKVIVNPLYEGDDIVSCKRQSEPMDLNDATRVASFINWNRVDLGEEAWIKNLETGEWTPPGRGLLGMDCHGRGFLGPSGAPQGA